MLPMIKEPPSLDASTSTADDTKAMLDTSVMKWSQETAERQVLPYWEGHIEGIQLWTLFWRLWGTMHLQ